MNSLTWHSVSATETGYVRSVNEDALLDLREQALWVVADGMGGHSFGDRASRTVIEQLADFSAGTTAQQSLDDIRSRLITANDLCRNEASGKIMGTTVAALYIHENQCFFIWAGDSRIYRHRGDGLVQLTEDHSYVQELVSLGELKREDMEQHPSSNIITRAVGVHSDLDIEITQATVQPGDRYLICTDGLFKDLNQGEIAGAMGLVSADETLDSLVQLALDRGGRDNITAIVMQASHA
ncbi:MAG: protein phosphatase 2C domain-containing protein [Pseudomonadota bacterium]